MTRKRLIVRVGNYTGALTTAYVIVWAIVAFALKSGITGWVDDRRADGWLVEHGTITIGGFPLSWRASIKTPHLGQANADRQYGWSGPAIALNWKPWSPQTVHYSTSGTHKFYMKPKPSAGLLNSTLEMASGQGHLVFGPHGPLSQLGILLDGANLSLPDTGAFRFNRLQAVIDGDPLSTGTKPTQPHLLPSVALDAEVFGLTFPAEKKLPLGRTIGRIALKGALLGKIQPGRPSDALSIWQKEGGTIEINRLDFGWGPLSVKTTGTMALDSALQPVAALTGKFTGYSETLDALVAARMVKPRLALVGKFALGAMARPSSDSGQSEIKVPVTLQKSWLTLGTFQLLKVPTIRWD